MSAVLVTLQAPGRPQTKIYARHRKGAITRRTPANVHEWRQHLRPFRSAGELFAICDDLATVRRDTVAISGLPAAHNPCDPSQSIHRLLRPQPGAADMAGRRLPANAKTTRQRVDEGSAAPVSWLPTIVDGPSAALFLDFDKIEVPASIDWRTEPEALAEWLRDTRLPGCFRDVACWYSLTSSAGDPRKPGDDAAAMRLVFTLDHPLTFGQRAKLVEGCVDPATLRPAQIIYLAAPIFQDGLRDPIRRRHGTLDGLDDVVTVPAEIVAYVAPERPQARHTGTLRDRSGAAGIGLLPSPGMESVLDDLTSDQGAVRSTLGRAARAYVRDVGADCVDIEALAERLELAALEHRSEGEVAGYNIDGLIRWTIDHLDEGPAEAGTRTEPTPALPEYYPRPEGDRETTLAGQRAFLTGFVDDAERRFRCVAEAHRLAVEAHDAIAADLRITEFSPPAELRVFRARKAVATRRIRRETARRHGFAGYPHKGARALVTGGQGTGKTRTTLEALAVSDAPMIVAMLAPTLAKAAEAKRDYDAMHPARPSILLRGRGAPFGDDGATMCVRATTVERAARAGVQVRKEICATCPFRDDCAYLDQETELRRMKEAGAGFVAFAASSYLYTPSPLDRADMIVVDEDVVMKAAKIIEMDPSRIKAAELWTGGAPEDAADRAADAASILDALTAHPDRELEALRAAGVDRDRIAALTRHLVETGDIVPTVEGRMSDAEINRKIDEVERRETGKVLALLATLRRELKTTRRGTNAVRRDPKRRCVVDGEVEYLPRIVVHGLRRTANWVGDRAPILALDGTGNVELARHVFGDRMTGHRFAVERRMTVTQTTGKSFSKVSLTGTNKAGEVITAARRRDAAVLREQVKAFAARRNRAFLAASKAVREALGDVEAMTGHFGALRGVNAYEACLAAIVLGREQPAPGAIEDLARCFAVAREERLLTVDSYVTCTRRRRMRDPAAVSVETVEVHPDPLAQAILEQVREAECVQTLDRVRAIFADREGWILNTLVLDITIDCVSSWKAVRQGWRGGSRWTEALHRGREAGVMPLSYGELSRVWPDLWTTGEAARADLKGVWDKAVETQIDSLFGKPPLYPNATYWTTERQKKPHRAWVRLDITEADVVTALGLTPLRMDAEVAPIPVAEEHAVPELHRRTLKREAATIVSVWPSGRPLPAVPRIYPPGGRLTPAHILAVMRSMRAPARASP